MADTNNHDIAGIARRINRFLEEVQKSVSSESSNTNTFDFDRALTYLDAITAYHDHAVAQRPLDLPETHPRVIVVEDGPDLVAIENESLTDLCYLLKLAKDELMNSQSSRNSAGLISFDSSRLLGVIVKARTFMTDYVANVTPLDLPESSPMRDGAEDGRSGI